jgi:hypothetical protein
MKTILGMAIYVAALAMSLAAIAQPKAPRPAVAASSSPVRYFQLAINLKFGASGEQQATTQTITTEVAVRGAGPGSCKARMVSQIPTGSGTGTKYLEVGTSFDANDIHIEGGGVALHFVLSTSRPVKMINYTRRDGVEMEEPIITDRAIELTVKLPLDQPKVVFDSSSKVLLPLKPLKGLSKDDPSAEAAAGPPAQDQPMVIELTATELK